MDVISKEDLLAALLAGPYSHFRKVGDDDWRDPSEKNAGFSLSIKGFRDHRSGESGGLHELAKKHDLAFPNGHPPIDKGNRAQFVWDKSTRTDDQQSEAHRLVTAYLNQHRRIPLGNFADLLSLRLLRFNHYKEDLMLVYPTLTPENYRDAVAGKEVSSTAFTGFSSTRTAPSTSKARNILVPKRQSPAASSSLR